MEDIVIQTQFLDVIGLSKLEKSVLGRLTPFAVNGKIRVNSNLINAASSALQQDFNTTREAVKKIKSKRKGFELQNRNDVFKTALKETWLKIHNL